MSLEQMLSEEKESSNEIDMEIDGDLSPKQKRAFVKMLAKFIRYVCIRANYIIIYKLCFELLHVRIRKNCLKGLLQLNNIQMKMCVFVFFKT